MTTTATKEVKKREETHHAIFSKCQMKVWRIRHGYKNIESLPKTTCIVGYLRHKVSETCTTLKETSARTAEKS